MFSKYAELSRRFQLSKGDRKQRRKHQLARTHRIGNNVSTESQHQTPACLEAAADRPPAPPLPAPAALDVVLRGRLDDSEAAGLAQNSIRAKRSSEVVLDGKLSETVKS